MTCTPSTAAIYGDTNGQVEKISQVLDAVFVKVLPQCSIWPKFFVSFVTYLTTLEHSAVVTSNSNTSIDIDLRNEVFQLPAPMW